MCLTNKNFTHLVTYICGCMLLCLVSSVNFVKNLSHIIDFVGVLRYPPVADYANLNYFRSRITVLNNGDILAGAM